jgi:cell division protein FtsZ
VVEEVASADEPSLFETLDAEQAASQDMAEDIFDNDVAEVDAQDDLPPPAYKPEVAVFEPKGDHSQAEEQPEAFVAPRAPGTPSPEAMARLRAAAEKSVPRSETRVAHSESSDNGERPRFGINSLINRMTGQGESGASVRQQPPLQQRDAAPAEVPQDRADPDQERIEIPAFLRRQAN